MVGKDYNLSRAETKSRLIFSAVTQDGNASMIKQSALPAWRLNTASQRFII